MSNLIRKSQLTLSLVSGVTHPLSFRITLYILFFDSRLAEAAPMAGPVAMAGFPPNFKCRLRPAYKWCGPASPPWRQLAALHNLLL